MKAKACDHFIVRTMNLNAKHWPVGEKFVIECALELGHKGPHRTVAGGWLNPIKEKR